MSTIRVPFTFAALFLLASSCAGTSLEVPPESAANPEADTMPIANEASPLREDYDPRDGSENDASAGHAGHDMHDMHESQAPQMSAPPAKDSVAPEPAAPAHGGHDHE
jgi:hypothetical protein